MTVYWFVPSLRDLPDYIGVCIVIVFFGAILSGASEMLQWMLRHRWQHLLPVPGSLMMVSIFVLGTSFNLPEFMPPFDMLPSSSTVVAMFAMSAMFTVGSVVASLILALRAGVRALKEKTPSN